MLKTHGITENTPKRVALGAGIVVKGLTFDTAWKYDAILGATSGGNSLTIENELKDLEIDGAWVKVEGMTVKTGETATLETNLAEVTKENLKMLVLGTDGEGVTGFDEIVSKDVIESGDYIENLGFIGHTATGDAIIVKFDKALCTSGLNFEGKNKDQTVLKATFECYASLDAENLKKLPYHIYTVQA